MTHGTPDWGVTAGAVTVHKLTDLGELAVRLGSIVTHDRRGDVIFLDNFEDGLGKWDTGSDGGGDSVALSSARARSGRLSALLTSGSGVGGYAQIFRGVNLPVLSGLGVELSFSVPVALETLVLQLHVLDGSRRYRFEVTYDDANNRLDRLHVGGGLTTVASGLVLAGWGRMFHTLKLVGNTLNGKYGRLILNDETYDLEGAVAYNGTDYGAPRLELTVTARGRDGYNDAVHIDDVIITQNEPA